MPGEINIMPLRGLRNVKTALSNISSDLNDELKGVIFQGLSNIQIGTPVDSGRARNNWFLSVGYPETTVTDSTTGNEIEFTSLPENILDKKLYYTNNLPYIERLEYDGWSQQAPTGWVRVELLKVREAIKKL